MAAEDTYRYQVESLLMVVEDAAPASVKPWWFLSDLPATVHHQLMNYPRSTAAVRAWLRTGGGFAALPLCVCFGCSTLTSPPRAARGAAHHTGGRECHARKYLS